MYTGFGDATADCVAKSATAIQAQFNQDMGAAAGDPTKLAQANATMAAAMNALSQSCAAAASKKKYIIIGAVLLVVIGGIILLKRHHKN